MASSATAKITIESKNLSPVQIGLLLLIGLLTITIVALAIRSNIRTSSNTNIFRESSLLTTNLADIQRQTLLLSVETERVLRDPQQTFEVLDLWRSLLSNQLRLYAVQASGEQYIVGELERLEDTLAQYDVLVAQIRDINPSEREAFAEEFEEILYSLDMQLKSLYDKEEQNFFQAFTRSLEDQSISETFLLVASTIMSVLGAVIFISLGRSFRRLKAETTVRIQKEAEAQQLAKENVILAEIGRIMNSSVDVNEVYELFSERVRQLIDFDRIVIAVVNHENSSFTTSYVSGLHVPDRDSGDITQLAGSALSEVMESHTSLLVQARNIEEVQEQFPHLVPAFKSGIRSFLTVPLVSNGDVIGSLNLRSLTPNTYTEHDILLANQVANQIAGAIVNSQLYSDREILQEQFIQAQKMEAIGQLAGGIAHDFNNLLTPIMGYSQMVLTKLPQGDKQRTQLEEVYKAAERATGLVHQLLAFSRKQVIEPKVLKVNELIIDLGKMLRRLIGEDIELLTSLSDDLGRTRADPNQIDQLLLNLVVNARDALPNGGKIRIVTANVTIDEEYASEHMDCSPGQYIMIAASDNGIGMTEETRARIFEPFFTTKDVGKGTGLGLATCYGIVKQNEGHIAVDSELGEGTTFKIYLPMIDDPIAADSQDSDSGIMPKGTETILLVEDEYAVRGFSSSVLREQGYTVIEASDGLEALEIAHIESSPNIDLLLTDVVMPRLGGKELAEEFTKIFPEARVVFASGYPDNSITREGILEPGTIFIQKPFTPLSLTRKVREALDSPPLDSPAPEPSPLADEWVELPR